MAVVYVVADEPTNRELVGACLTGDGHTLVEFARGDDAVAACDSQPPDLVLLDLVMPGLEGIGTVERLKRRHGPFLPVIVVSALNDTESRRQSLLAGADDFLLQPFDAPELIIRVRNQLARRQSSIEQLALKAELLELRRFRTAMAQTIVHDLRNPSCAVLASIDYVLEEWSTLPGEVVEALQDAQKASHRVGELLSNLADMTRIEEGQLQLVRKQVASDDLLRELAAPRECEARRRKIEITYGVASGAEQLDIDRSLFMRMIENLLDNAIRYTPPKGRISVSIRRADSGMRIEVGNSGAPAPDCVRTVVFDKLGQTDGDSGRMNLGLGLHFSRRAVEAHGGRIWVEERPELSTVFCIDLPDTAHA